MNSYLIYKDSIPHIPYSFPKIHRIAFIVSVLLYITVSVISIMRLKSDAATAFDFRANYLVITVLAFILIGFWWYVRQICKQENHDLNEILKFLHQNKDGKTLAEIKVGVGGNITSSVKAILEALLEGGFIKSKNCNGLTVYEIR